MQIEPITLTPAEFFQQTIDHFQTQGHRAFAEEQLGDVGGFCTYRAPNGDRCAVGKWIPDELYDPSMEKKTVDDHFPLPFPEVR